MRDYHYNMALAGRRRADYPRRGRGRGSLLPGLDPGPLKRGSQDLDEASEG